jgi:hypothetical protein
MLAHLSNHSTKSHPQLLLLTSSLRRIGKTTNTTKKTTTKTTINQQLLLTETHHMTTSRRWEIALLAFHKNGFFCSFYAAVADINGHKYCPSRSKRAGAG